MDTNTKTPVDIIQELLAILSTRKEVAEKLASKGQDLGSTLENANTQSDDFIAALMEELSHFGDAVQGETDRENTYQMIWKKAFAEIDNMSPEAAKSTFNELESALRDYYDSLNDQQELPESLRNVLDEQKGQLK